MKVIGYYVVLLLIGLSLAGINIIACILALIIGSKRSRRVIRPMILAIIRAYGGLIEIWGLGRFIYSDFTTPPAGQPQLYIANHTGLLDAVMLMQRIPGLSCIFKSRLRKNPILSHIPSAIGFAPNDEGIGIVRSMIEQLNSGTSVLIFPEGTRTVNPPVERFKTGFAIVATRTGVPVQTIFIDNPTGMTGKKRPLPNYPDHLPFPYHFRFGPVLRAEQGESARDFAARTEALYRRELSQTSSDDDTNRQTIAEN